MCHLAFTVSDLSKQMVKTVSWKPRHKNKHGQGKRHKEWAEKGFLRGEYIALPS
jgi:hypothetical protein